MVNCDTKWLQITHRESLLETKTSVFEKFENFFSKSSKIFGNFTVVTSLLRAIFFFLSFPPMETLGFFDLTSGHPVQFLYESYDTILLSLTPVWQLAKGMHHFTRELSRKQGSAGLKHMRVWIREETGYKRTLSKTFDRFWIIPPIILFQILDFSKK